VKTQTQPEPTNTPSTLEKTYGFGILNKVKGIWNGPVTSSTMLHDFPEWIVDFRPISANQISAKNELDSLNDIHLSLFITKYKNEYRVAFRNGGSFAGMHRVSYLLADSVVETSTYSYYRFSEVVKGVKRAYSEFYFGHDTMIMRSYTNKYNALASPVPHMVWTATLQDTTSCQAAVTRFNYPQKTLAKDFTNTFDGANESIYYDLVSDPYPESAQPYLGQTTVNYTYSSGFTPAFGKRTFLLITTQPLISGFTFNAANMKYRSRYVILSADDYSFTFNYMHPGSYYLYALYDADNNNYFSSGDKASFPGSTFTLSDKGTTTVTPQINFTIP
jgi:hypothetical protein